MGVLIDPETWEEVRIDKFLNDYKPATKLEWVKHYPASDPFNSSELQAAAIKGMVQASLYSMVHHTSHSGVHIMTLPEKKVIAGDGFEVGELSLAPTTLSITTEVDNNKTCPHVHWNAPSLASTVASFSTQCPTPKTSLRSIGTCIALRKSERMRTWSWKRWRSYRNSHL